MTRSLALWLAVMRARGQNPAAPTDRPDPPAGSGPLLWLRPGPEAGIEGLAELAHRLRRARPGLRLILTPDPGLGPLPEALALPEGTLVLPAPSETRADVAGFLARYRPDAALMTGAALPAITIHGARAAGLPLVLAEARMTEAASRDWRWRRGMAAELLAAFSEILAQDPDSARWLRRLGGRSRPVEISGPIESMCTPPGCNEAEREVLALLLRARPVWLAAACPESEEEAVLASHARAIQHAHRMLLILCPEDPDRGPALAERARALGWDVALRSQDEEPEPGIQVFIADTGAQEIGLWYRLAPVCFMGGTLTPDHRGRSPFEPAGLGSAILCGPMTDPDQPAYDRLLAAEAALRVADAEALAGALVDLLAADRAAILAHNAWALSSGGAGAAERVMRAVLSALGPVAELPAPAPAGARA